MKKNIRIALLLRKKIPGENSLEELAESFARANSDIIIYTLPSYPATIKGYIDNIRFVKKINADIFHIFSLNDAYLALYVKNVILTVHDVNTINYYKQLWKRVFARFTNIIIPSFFIGKIFCDSKNTRKEYLFFAPWTKKRTSVCHVPINENLSYSEKKINKTNPVILHIGTAHRKNLGNVIRSLSDVNCKLIIVGQLTNNQIELLSKNKIKYENFVDIPFSKIIELYKECDIVSFPSFYEGFGLPIIESNKVGRAVVGSTIPVFSEIAKDCFYMVEPNNIFSIKEGFLKLINDDDFRKNLITKGIENAKKYEIDNIIKIYNNAYYALLYK